MNELERHIEKLLLENDCVIVPGFGGFMTHHVAARYADADQTFLPPLRTIGFNPRLRINDSLLIHSYIEAYSMSYPEALKRVEGEVDALNRELHEAGFYELNNIGRLTLNGDGNIEFTPNEAGILTPEYYGLSSFSMKQLMPESTPEREATVLAIDDSADADSATISIKVAWIRNSIAIAAAVLAFFLISTPVSNNVSDEQFTLSSLQPTLPALEPAETSYYTIVLASQISKKNAETFVSQLKERGFDDAAIYIHNDVVRVVCGHYSSEEDAYREASEFRQLEDFSQSWVMQINEKSTLPEM